MWIYRSTKLLAFSILLFVKKAVNFIVHNRAIIAVFFAGVACGSYSNPNPNYRQYITIVIILIYAFLLIITYVKSCIDRQQRTEKGSLPNSGE